jgi:glycosyltransferase involved in cell wall biosynthesis
MIEALACGTPVVATPRGSVPEIVDDGRTGFIRADNGGLGQVLHRVAELDRVACREDASRRFSAARMVHDHLALFAALVASRRPSVPVAVPAGG